MKDEAFDPWASQVLLNTRLVIRGESFLGTASERLLADRDHSRPVYDWAFANVRENLGFRPMWRVT